MKKIYMLFVLFSVSSLCQSNSTEVWKYVQPKSYIAYKTSVPIIIDGLDEDPAWKNADWTDYFVDIEGSKKPIPYLKTRVKILWDDNYFYFFANLQEPNVWADITQRDAVIYYNNDFEIFFKPYTEFPQYCELEMNALNTVWDLLLLNAYREDGPIINNWNIKGLKTAVHIEGTINDPADTDKGWSVEIAYPRASLNELKFKSMKNSMPEIWRLNFSRVEWDYQIVNGKYSRKKDLNGNFLPEHNWVWSPQGVIDMHEPEFWGYVKFSNKKPGTDNFIPDPYEKEIQALFYLYKKEKEYFRKNGAFTRNINNPERLKFIFNSKIYKPKVALTNFGYEIFFDLTLQRLKIVINEKGIIKKVKY